ncbi:SusC/RagA family TonB-linked outer membrane protein [Arcticibacter eurypsychrophilus]|uniref:SusC/RagA family TonB-linked outer membrane protein n=1 Tax=Arcticibacter eurypsychrophilus TaxID=1434752 RepID=UPI00084DD50C|nr:SusC/RagA family TonB-linked outer membrane protein [Arcticibacter eurypsychrophilus]
MKQIKIGIVFCLTLMGIPAISSAKLAIKVNVYSNTGSIRTINPGIDKKVPNSRKLVPDSTQKSDESLQMDDSALVQVAFRKINKQDILGGVSVLNFSELMERNYATSSLENLEALAPGFNGNIWGMSSYLVLVDGVPRDANTVMPTEIDQITVLKGVAAVALYGSRAAKGVIYITTKRGTSSTQTVNIRANAGVNTPKAYPKFLGSAEYMTLYNEARQNDGLPALYSGETIYNHASGLNPYRYPNVDYYSSEYLNDSYNRYDLTAEISGGNEKARYYTNLGYWSAGSLLNFGEAVDNSGSNRFNVRGNIDVNLNKIISLNVDASVSFYTGKGVNTDYWASAASIRPYRFSPLVPIDMIEGTDESSLTYVNNSSNLIDGKYLLGGSQLDQTNSFANIYAGGYNKTINRQFQFNTGINFDLNSFIDGLTFKTMMAVDYSTSFLQTYNNRYAVYQASWNDYSGIDQISNLTKYGEDATSGVQNISGSTYRRTVAFSGQLNYIKSFNQKHNISAMLIANGFQLGEAQLYHNTSNANLGLQLGYNLSNKYYVDFSGAAVHSAKLPAKNRMGISPTLSLGWRVSKEGFMSKISAIDDLKFTVSAGILNTDLDINNYYLYQGYYTYNDAAWYSWRDGSLVHTFDRRRGDNPDLNYPQRKEINAGVDGSLFKNLLSFSGSVFYNKTTGNVVQPTTVTYPNYFTTGFPVYSDIPFINYNDDERKGLDFSVNLNKKSGNLFWSLGVTGTYFEATASKRAEFYEFGYQNRAGQSLDAIWGLQNEGFFMDQADIANSPTQSFGDVMPGDIKYKDQNADGVIDTRDEVNLGRGSSAPMTLGINFTAKWKSLTLFALGTGRFGGNAIKNNSYFWIDGEDKYSIEVRDRWTEETKNTATYPRLTTSNSDNNFRTSDFWIYSSNRFDLAKVQLSYQFPTRILGKGFVRELGTYVNGFNLLTFSKERETMELNVNQAPQTRFFNLGVKALF